MAKFEISKGNGFWGDELLRHVGVDPIFILTYSLPDLEYIEKLFKNQVAGAIYLVCNSKFSNTAKAIRSRFPGVNIRLNDRLHSKMMLILPDKVYIGSANLGHSSWHETVVKVVDEEECARCYHTLFKPVWHDSDPVRVDASELDPHVPSEVEAICPKCDRETHVHIHTVHSDTETTWEFTGIGTCSLCKQQFEISYSRIMKYRPIRRKVEGGEVIVTFGFLKGRKIKDLTRDELKSMIKWIEKEGLTEKFSEVYKAANDYLGPDLQVPEIGTGVIRK